MGSLKARFALLVGGAALLAVLAVGALFLALRATDAALERTVAAQHRLDLVAELSGRLSDYGLAAVDAAGSPSGRRERVVEARRQVDRALTVVNEAVGETVAGTESLLGRTEFAARSRPLARLRATLALLDRQVEQALDQPDPTLRADAVRGALNAFGAVSGPSLSFLVEAERRAVEATSAEARTLSDRLGTGALIAAALALAAAILLHRAVTRPLLARLDAIQRAAGAIGRGELDTRLPLRGHDELGLLVASFNRMAARLGRRERRLAADRAALEETVAQRTAALTAANARLESVDQSRRRFFADVSHELRTPLTVVLGECDVALRSPRTGGDDHRTVLGTIRKRAQQLHRRVEDLLRVARSDSGQIELDRRPVSLLTVLTEAVETLGAEAGRRGVALLLEPGRSDVEVVADRDWLRQIVEGLVDNALRHAAGATRITVALEETRGGARIAVEDDGPGFPAGNAARLFERFARGGGADDPGSRTAGARGFGIGLALARWVVERHGGAIRLETATATGTGARRGARVVVDLKGGESDVLKEDAA